MNDNNLESMDEYISNRYKLATINTDDLRNDEALPIKLTFARSTAEAYQIKLSQEQKKKAQKKQEKEEKKRKKDEEKEERKRKKEQEKKDKQASKSKRQKKAINAQQVEIEQQTCKEIIQDLRQVRIVRI